MAGGIQRESPPRIQAFGNRFLRRIASGCWTHWILSAKLWAVCEKHWNKATEQSLIDRLRLDRRQKASHLSKGQRTQLALITAICPEPELLDLVLERYEEAVKGDLRMNCDSCVYRIALPGFEDKVGLPQQPHFHPDDDGHHHHGDGHAHSHGHSHAH